MKLSQIFPGHALSADPEITGITADSRRVAPGFLFAAMKGTKDDGARFVPAALEKGAAAILCADPVDTGHAVLIRHDDPRLALADASARFHPLQPGIIAAITGTNGKSSTVDFLRQIWTLCDMRAASLGTLGAVGPEGVIDLGHTTPDPVAIHATLETLARQGVTHAAMEASSHGLEQRRLHAVKLAAVAFTNLTQDHLDYHPDFESYRHAKLRLFTELAPAGIPAIVNADSSEYGVFEAAAREAGLKVWSVGWRGRDVKIRELSPRATGQVLDLLIHGVAHEVELPLIGEFQALNALTAAALALALGTPLDPVLGALGKLAPVSGRLEFIGTSASGGSVFVDYAHTPDGLDVLLRAVRPHTAGKLVCIMGCGGDRDPYKRPVMGETAARYADEVIVTDDNPRSEDPGAIRAAILSKAAGATEIGDRAAAISEGIARLGTGDTLVIAGKGHETGQIVGDKVLPFADQETARQMLGQTS